MTNNIPGWNFESDTCVTNQKRSIGPDQELVELLWQNGQVVLNSQTQRKQVGNSSDMRQVHKNDVSTLRTSGPYGNSSNLSQEDEIISWLQYPLEDPLEQQFCSNFLPEIAPYEVESYKQIKRLEEGNFSKFVASSAPHATLSSQSPNMKPSSVQEFQANPMPVPRFHVPDSSKLTTDFGRSKKVSKLSHFSAPPNVSSVSADAQVGKKVSTNMSQNEGRECSVMTVGSSHCGSNHIPQDPDVSMVSSSGWATTLSAETKAARDYVQRTIPGEKGKSEMVEPNLTSSSGGSGSSLGKTCSLSTENLGHKRKRTDAEESEEQSEATELKSGIGSKASQQAGSSRRNRVAEVHNLSERRRRDRINEKMRALQQLIPNSNKTDKASMLEEAIEYLKSLQLQLQVMWMGASMSPMMFPGIQHYLSQMSMGMAAPSLPSIQNPMQLPILPLDQSMSLPQTPNQNVMCQNPVLGAFNYQNQIQNTFLAEQYARYMGYHLMQSTTQPTNAYRYGSQALQHGQTMITPGSSSGPTSGAANMDDSMSAKMGSSTYN